MRRLTCLVALLVLGNAAPGPEAPPEALEFYVADGELKTGDFGWMRGAFEGASEKQSDDWKSIQAWSQTCGISERKAIADELAQMGVRTALKEMGPTGSPSCHAVREFAPLAQQAKNWEEFIANEKMAREIFAIYQFGAQTALQQAPYERAWGVEEGWTLMYSTVMEQIYRTAMSWQSNDKAPKVDPALTPYFNAHLGNAMLKADRKNTAMLKELVAKRGWPTEAMVGERASFSAWLLVQHADHDPAFQLKALRLMEPLVAKGEVNKRNYAYLYDRVMLKINGKQRFGTQVGECKDGKVQLRPLEDETALTGFRKSHDLEPVDEYIGRFKHCARG